MTLNIEIFRPVPEGSVEVVLATDGNLRELAVWAGGQFYSHSREHRDYATVNGVACYAGDRVVKHLSGVCWVANNRFDLNYERVT